MIRVGLIGAGFMGTMHSSVYSFLPNVKVAAVCDLDREKAEKIAQQQGAKVYTDPDALLADSSLKLDLVDICLPTFLHAEYACKAAASGLNVLCEKPFALDLQSVDKIISAVDEAKVKLMVGQCVRFWPEYQVLKQVATEGRFGEIQGAWFSRLSPLPTWGWENWLLDPARSGGAAFDMHIHDTDFILYLLGKPQAVFSTAIEDQYGLSHISTQYLYDKLMVTAEAGWNYPAKFPFQAKFRVVFQEAVLALEERGLIVYPGDGADPYSIEIKKDTSESSAAGGNISDLGGYYNEIKYYLDCLEKGESPKVVTAQSARESVAVTVAEIESAKSGKIVSIS